MKKIADKNFLAYLDWLSKNWDVFDHVTSEKKRQPPHPGEVLNEQYLKRLKMSQTKLSLLIGCSHAKINEVVKGKRGITPEFALALEKALGTSADFWLSLQASYDLWKARSKG